ncbi:MAG: dihydrolipoyl dehydrogenase [Chloroflexi bacterium]|nr:dihydrolipoyl dehydrogenase [Chloroflexota bacterium]
MVMGEETLQTELLVIGGGTGGYSAAFRAADLGVKVALVNDEKRLGGVCLHRGCIPAKSLLQPARLMMEARRADDWGVAFADPSIDVEKLRSWKDGVVDKLVNGLETLSERRDIRIVRGHAVFESSNQVRLRNPDMVSNVEFEHAIIATGSRPIALPGTEFKSDSRIMDSATALGLPEIPETLLIVGGGYIGLEMGMIYASLGSRITLVELLDGLLPGTDRELVKPVAQEAAGMFEAIHLNTSVESLQEETDGVLVEFNGDVGDEQQKFDRVLIAIGRQPSTDKLQLENTDVELDDHGFIRVDAERRTTEEHIFAVGDAAGKPLLAHKSMHEGKIAAEVIAGKPASFDVRCIPKVIFTEPELALCGLSEEDAHEQGYAVEIGRFPWRASGRALTKGAPDGLTKIVFDAESGRVLGVGIVGSGAAELIAEGALAIEMGAVAHDLALTIHPHPTLSETISEAAEAFLEKPIHTLA